MLDHLIQQFVNLNEIIYKYFQFLQRLYFNNDIFYESNHVMISNKNENENDEKIRITERENNLVEDVQISSILIGNSLKNDDENISIEKQVDINKNDSVIDKINTKEAKSSDCSLLADDSDEECPPQQPVSHVKPINPVNTKEQLVTKKMIIYSQESIRNKMENDFTYISLELGYLNHVMKEIEEEKRLILIEGNVFIPQFVEDLLYCLEKISERCMV